MKYFRIFIFTILCMLSSILLIEVIVGNTNCVYALVFSLVYVILTINYWLNENRD